MRTWEGFEKLQAKLLWEAHLDKIPPSLNSIWRRGHGHTYKVKAAVDWQTMAEWELKAQGRLLQEPLTGKIRLSVLFCRKDAKRWDVDNRNKLLCDLLQHCGIIENDNQIWKITSEKRTGKEHTVIEIYEMEE